MSHAHIVAHLPVGCNSNLWFLRVSTFASAFFSKIVLQERMELRARCPSIAACGGEGRIPTNMAAAVAHDDMLTTSNVSRTGNVSKNDLGAASGSPIDPLKVIEAEMYGSNPPPYASKGSGLQGISLVKHMNA